MIESVALVESDTFYVITHNNYANACQNKTPQHQICIPKPRIAFKHDAKPHAQHAIC